MCYSCRIMRITLLTNEYPPNIYGGAGVHVEHLSQELARIEGAAHEIRVICFGAQDERKGNLTVKGVRLPIAVAGEAGLGILGETLLRDALMSEAVQDMDIIHCHTWYTHLAGCMAKAMFGAPLVLTTHSLEPQRPWKAEQLGLGYRASTWIEKTAYNNADGVIAVSDSMKDAVCSLYGVPESRVGVIPNGVDVTVYRPTGNPGLLEKYGIDVDRPYILFVGRVTRQKGIIHLVNAIKYISPGIQVVLCAGKPDTEEIGKEMSLKVEEARATTGRHVVWIREWVSKQHLAVLYTHAAAFVCPSIYEPFGIINLEAMACGTPVVASAVGGIPDVVNEGLTGLLVPFEAESENNPEPGDAEKFAKDLALAINSLADNPQRVEGMRRACRQWVLSHFTWTVVAGKTLDFYQGLL